MNLLDEVDPPCPRGCGRSLDECEEAEDGSTCAGSELVQRLERMVRSRDDTIGEMGASNIRLLGQIEQLRADRERTIAVHTQAYAELSRANADLAEQHELVRKQMVKLMTERDAAKDEAARARNALAVRQAAEDAVVEAAKQVVNSWRVSGIRPGILTYIRALTHAVDAWAPAEESTCCPRTYS